MHRKKFFLICFFLLLPAVLFFSRLFLPKISLFYTPDLGRSDLWHFNYPIKDFLSKSLKNFHLPLWSNTVGNGFPFFAESQIGALNLFNLCFFFIFQTPLAINLTYLFTFIFAALGCYLLGRELKLSVFASIFLANIFSFSGFLITHIPHSNLVQAASFLPWLVFANIKLIKKKQIKYLVLFSFLLAEQLFCGHSQIVFISLFTLLLYNLAKVKFKADRKSLNILFLFTLAVAGGLLLATVQLLPTYQLKNLSSRKSGISYQSVTKYVYPFQQLITFLNPFILGNPADGTFYQRFDPQKHIFWENTAYLGLIPIFTFFYYLFTKKNKKKLLSPFFFVAIFTFLLIFGKTSPLYFIFTLPPFNWFRVPSRFLLPLILAIALFAAQGVDNLAEKIKKQRMKTAVYILLIIFSVVDLYLNFHNYHPTVSKKEALAMPKTARFLKNKTTGKIFHYQQAFSEKWNDTFLEKGWQNTNPYLYAKNSLDATQNMLFGFSSIDHFQGLVPRKTSLLLYILRQGVIKKENNSVQIPPFTKKIFDIFSIEYFLSPVKVENKNLRLTKKIAPPNENLYPVYIYKNPQFFPKFWFADSYVRVISIRDYIMAIGNKNYNHQQTVVSTKQIPGIKKLALHHPQLEKSHSKLKAKILQQKKQSGKQTLTVQTNKKTLLVINQSPYPFWQAKINSQKTKIYPVNANQQAIIVPPGKQTISLSKKFSYLKIGSIISGITLLIGSAVLILYPNKNLDIL